MPELSRFNGIVIKIHWEKDERHHKPHVHVYYNEYEAVIGIDGDVLVGSLPEKQYTLVKAWLYLHEDALYDAWNRCVRNEPIEKKSPRSNRRSPMYIHNGIVYAGTPEKPLRVTVVEPLENHRLRLTFSDGAQKLFDLAPLLQTALYAPLRDEKVFNRVYLDYGVVSWNDGAIDIATSVLYADGVASKKETA